MGKAPHGQAEPVRIVTRDDPLAMLLYICMSMYAYTTHTCLPTPVHECAHSHVHACLHSLLSMLAKEPYIKLQKSFWLQQPICFFYEKVVLKMSYFRPQSMGLERSSTSKTKGSC